MSRFRLEHPNRTDIHAYAGHDHAVGPFWVELFKQGRSRPYKSLDLLTTSKPVSLNDALAFLIANTFMTEAELHEALAFIQDGSPKPTDMRVVEVVLGFKRAC